MENENPYSAPKAHSSENNTQHGLSPEDSNEGSSEPPVSTSRLLIGLMLLVGAIICMIYYDVKIGALMAMACTLLLNTGKKNTTAASDRKDSKP
jgi:hypothetical protein